ncbi:MAG TPA: hypothetical protein VLI66_09770 [Terrabacter sp.]|nr:hypothetical protein [Terrabacter sp.]
MFSPRNLMVAGVVLVAIALGPAGHGLWWLVGFVWLLPRMTRHGHCGQRRMHRHGAEHDDTAVATEPDPTRDRHQAFPAQG